MVRQRIIASLKIKKKFACEKKKLQDSAPPYRWEKKEWSRPSVPDPVKVENQITRCELWSAYTRLSDSLKFRFLFKVEN